MKQRKKKKLVQRNPVVREMLANPKRSVGRHDKVRKVAKRDERRLQEH
jgi:hypothetical protein